MNNPLIFILLFLVLGILFGLRNKRIQKNSKFIDKAISGTVYLLLFILGINAGANEKVINQLHSLGLTALLITIFIIISCLFLARITFQLFFKKNEK